jgi:phosphatidylserine decarboxylase
MSGNDFIGEATLSISELMKNAPAPNPETGLHDSDGRHDMEEFRLQLETHGSSWGSKHTPTIVIRAKWVDQESKTRQSRH